MLPGVRRGPSRREPGARHVPCPERRDAQEIVVAGAAAAIRDLNPGYFAPVMTTGIVSRAMSLDVASRLSGFLLRTGIVACVLLVAACTWRFADYRTEVLAGLGDFEITATKTDLHRALRRAGRPFNHSRMLLR
jgi:hypothetical protein